MRIYFIRTENSISIQFEINLYSWWYFYTAALCQPSVAHRERDKRTPCIQVRVTTLAKTCSVNVILRLFINIPLEFNRAADYFVHIFSVASLSQQDTRGRLGNKCVWIMWIFFCFFFSAGLEKQIIVGHLILKVMLKLLKQIPALSERQAQCLQTFFFFFNDVIGYYKTANCNFRRQFVWYNCKKTKNYFLVIFKSFCDCFLMI